MKALENVISGIQTPMKSKNELDAIRRHKKKEKKREVMAGIDVCRRETASIRAIFFDLDNTLINTRKGDKLACEKVL